MFTEKKTNDMDYKPLAKLFTSADISKVAKGNYSTVVELQESFDELADLDTLQDIYEEAYRLLRLKYPNEYVVKNTIANRILLGKHSMNTASMLSELRIGSNKADCVVVNGLSTCYEIKTQLDSLKRLPDQLHAYTRAFDKTYVVTHESHLNSVLKLHDDMPVFGIIRANKNGNLSRPIKEAPLNTEFDLELMYYSLRKSEYTNIAKTVLGKEPEVPCYELFDYCKSVFCSLPSDKANQLFKENLKHFRKNDHKFINSLPESLKNIGISYKIDRKGKNSIISSLLNNIEQQRGYTNVLSIPTW
ncbi:sce7726 family protein [Photobacterium galatheae]|nr:sce7726 family protein [Photobacterium galatheae]